MLEQHHSATAAWLCKALHCFELRDFLEKRVAALNNLHALRTGPVRSARRFFFYHFFESLSAVAAQHIDAILQANEGVGPVPSRASDLLRVGAQRVGTAEVCHETHVRFIYTHAKSTGCADDIDLKHVQTMCI